MIYTALAARAISPGNELMALGLRTRRTMPASRNYAGICDPAVDQLIEMIIIAPNRDEQIAATRALDRVLTWSTM